MSGWGALAGLGDGLMTVGKTMLLNNLEKEREERAEARDIAAEQREQQEYGKTTYEQVDGIWYEVDISKGGEDIDRRIAPQNKVQEFKMDRRSKEAGLAYDLARGEKVGIETSLTRKELENYDADRAREVAADQAQIEATRARTGASRARAASYNRPDSIESSFQEEPAGPTPDSGGRSLVHTYKDLVKSYTDPDLTDTPITQTSVERIAREAYIVATKQGKSYGDTFIAALEDFQRMKKQGLITNTPQWLKNQEESSNKDSTY